MSRPLPAQLVLAALVAGLAAANVARGGVPAACALGGGLVAIGCAAGSRGVALAIAVAAAAGWGWGSVRLTALDRSSLAADVDRAGYARLVVTGAPRRGAFSVRAPARAERFEGRRLSEPVELQFPIGRAPPQGEVVSALVVVRRPLPAANGFDERTWLRRQGVHVVLHVDAWRALGRRHGLAGRADALRRWLRRAAGGRLRGRRRALVEGVLLGDDAALSPGLKTDFRRSGLYHLLAVSGENVVLLVAGVRGLCRLAGVPRLTAHILSLVALAAYVVAVGPQPSVIRAAVSGGVASAAWLLGRQRDRWQALGLGAAVLLAWDPYLVFDAGFQLSFAAVGAIFVVVGPLLRELEGYPLPAKVGAGVAVSVACGVATAPILWLQFGQVPLLGVVANAAAEPAVAPLLALAFAAAAVAPVSATLAAALAWLNGWVAAYLALCARAVGAVPFAQATGRGANLAVAGALLAAAYAVRRWRTS